MMILKKTVQEIGYGTNRVRYNSAALHLRRTARGLHAMRYHIGVENRNSQVA